METYYFLHVIATTLSNFRWLVIVCQHKHFIICVKKFMIINSIVNVLKIPKILNFLRPLVAPKYNFIAFHEMLHDSVSFGNFLKTKNKQIWQPEYWHAYLYVCPSNWLLVHYRWSAELWSSWHDEVIFHAITAIMPLSSWVFIYYWRVRKKIRAIFEFYFLPSIIRHFCCKWHGVDVQQKLYGSTPLMAIHCNVLWPSSLKLYSPAYSDALPSNECCKFDWFCERFYFKA